MYLLNMYVLPVLNLFLITLLIFSKIQRKLKRVKKEEYEEVSTKEKKTYYVKKEKKSKMFQCSSCDYSSDYHAQIDQHTFKQHSSLCTQVFFWQLSYFLSWTCRRSSPLCSIRINTQFGTKQFT